MLKSVPGKRQSILDQEKNRQRLETDIAQLINENNSLRTQVTHLVSQLDYAKRSYEEKYDALLEKEDAIMERIELANQEASAIINKAYRNADLIIQEVLASADNVLQEMESSASYNYDITKKLEFKTHQLAHILSGVDAQAVKNLMIFNKDHDTFFKK